MCTEQWMLQTRDEELNPSAVGRSHVQLKGAVH